MVDKGWGAARFRDVPRYAMIGTTSLSPSATKAVQHTQPSMWEARDASICGGKHVKVETDEGFTFNVTKVETSITACGFHGLIVRLLEPWHGIKC